MRGIMAAAAMLSWAIVIGLALLGHLTPAWGWTAGAITLLALIACVALDPGNSDDSRH